MQTVNLTNILGHIGNEPQLTTLPNGTKKTTVSIATNSGSGENQKTQWHTALFWGEFAEVAAKFKKGEGLFVSGYNETRKWTDPNSGQQREKTEIHVQDFSKSDKPLKTINQAIVMGHLGGDAQFKQFPNNAKTTISIATNTGSGDRQKTQWHNIILWGKAAEMTSKLKKGDTLFIKGNIEYRKWNDTNTGQAREKTEITAQQFIIITGEHGQMSNSTAVNGEPQQSQGYANNESQANQGFAPYNDNFDPNDCPPPPSDEIIPLPY